MNEKLISKWIGQERERLLAEDKEYIISLLKDYYSEPELNSESSIAKLDEIISICEENNEMVWVAFISIIKASNFTYTQQNLKLGMQEYIKIINMEVFNEFPMSELKTCMYRYIMECFYKMDKNNNSEQVQTFMEQTLSEISPNDKCYTCFSQSLSDIYKNKGMVSEYKKCYKKILKDPEIEDYISYKNSYLEGLGECHLKKNEPKKALEYFKKYENIIFTDECSLEINKAKSYFELKDLNKAEIFANKALSLSQEKNLPYEISNSYFILGKIEYAKNNQKKSLNYLVKAYKIIKNLGFNRNEIKILNKIIQLKENLNLDSKTEKKILKNLSDEITISLSEIV